MIHLVGSGAQLSQTNLVILAQAYPSSPGPYVTWENSAAYLGLDWELAPKAPGSETKVLTL